MKWINKATHRVAGNQVSKDYLDNCCKRADGRYHNVRYDKRDSGTGLCFCNANHGAYRKEMTKILLNNQNGYCCYCMRKLKTSQDEIDSDEVITREHIIPRDFTQAQNRKVQDYYQNCPNLAADKVILTDEFESATCTQTLPPFPHIIAYDNLVASCNGTFPYVRNASGGKSKICCNEARKSNDAFPVYFINNIEEMIDYKENGDIYIKTTVNRDNRNRIEDVIKHANLACDMLKDIRRLWFILSHVPKERIYGSTTGSQRDALLSEMLYKTEYFDEHTPYLHDNYQKDDFWHTFMLYDYFYDVFSNC